MLWTARLSVEHIEKRDFSSASSASSASFIDDSSSWATADGPLEATGPARVALGGQLFQKRARTSSEGNTSSRIEAIPAVRSDEGGRGLAPDLLETQWPLPELGARRGRRERAATTRGQGRRRLSLFVVLEPLALPSIRCSALSIESV